MKLLEDSRLITAILPVEVDVAALLQRLREEKQILSANVNFGRGVGRSSPIGDRRLGDEKEKEVLNVIVEAERADEIFEFLHAAADIDRPHGGLLFMTRLRRSTRFELPDLPDET